MTFTYSLTADLSGGGFKINATTGVVTVDNPAPDQFRGQRQPQLQHHGAGRPTASSPPTQTFTINVSDNVAPTTPTDTNGAANTGWKARPNTVVGVTANSTDIHGGTVTYSIAPGGDSCRRRVHRQCRPPAWSPLADATKIDYESARPDTPTPLPWWRSHGTLTSSQTFTIAVTDAPGLDTGRRQQRRKQRRSRVPPSARTVGLTAFATDPNGPN